MEVSWKCLICKFDRNSLSLYSFNSNSWTLLLVIVESDLNGTVSTWVKMCLIFLPSIIFPVNVTTEKWLNVICATPTGGALTQLQKTPQLETHI